MKKIKPHLLLWLLGVGSLLGQESEPLKLTVATKEAPPFVMKDVGGSWTGLTMEFLDLLEKEANLTMEFEEATLEEMLRKVEQGGVDMAAAAITANADRESVMDFTHPYFPSGLGLAYKTSSSNSFFGGLKRLFTIEFLQAVSALAVVIAGAGVAMWWFERRKNQEQFGGSTAEGLGNGFWWSAVTMTTVGYGDKSPITLGGRVVGLIWMFASILIVSGLTAAIATALTVQQLGQDMLKSRHVSSIRLAVIEGSTGQQMARRSGWLTITFDDLDQAVAAVKGDRADALLYDRPILLYLASEEHPGEIEVAPDRLSSESYSLALPSGSVHRDRLNVAILKILESEEWKSIRMRYLGEE